MKFLKYLTIPLLLCTLVKGQENSADSILQLLHKQLQIGSFHYKQVRETFYKMDRHEVDYTKLAWDTKIHFHSERLYDFDFLINKEDGGSLRFRKSALETTDENGNVVIGNAFSGLEDISYLSALYNSILTLRNSIPLILTAEDIRKTMREELLEGQPVYEICLNVGKRRLKNLGNDFDRMETMEDFFYYVYVDKKRNLPLKIVQKFGSSEIKTTFENLVNL